MSRPRGRLALLATLAVLLVGGEALARQERVPPPKRDPGRRQTPPRRATPPPQRPVEADAARRNAGALAWDGGFQLLRSRLGRGAPTGRGVVVAQVEATQDGQGFAPDRDHRAFRGVTFLLKDPSAPVSAHATMVGRRFYGRGPVGASGVERVLCLEANDALQGGLLGIGSEAMPPAPPDGLKVVCNAWVGGAGERTAEVILRADFLAARDQVLFVNGLPNSGDQPLMRAMANGIAVGTFENGHSGSTLLAGAGAPLEGCLPRICAPGGLTSAATPMVGAAAAILAEASGAPTEVRADLLVAVLLAGARAENAYTGAWSNGARDEGTQRGTAVRPLDPAVGAGHLDVAASHEILVAGRVEPVGTTATGDESGRAIGWCVTDGTTRGAAWIVEVPAGGGTLQATAHWQRSYREGDTPFLADQRLVLMRIADTRDDGVASRPTGLTGDAGRAVFTRGNVVSDATDGSVEHLRVEGLIPGRYVLACGRKDDRGGAVPVAIAWRVAAPGVSPAERP